MLHRLALAVLALLFATASAFAQETDPERLEAVKEFQRFFKKFKTESEQREAVLTLRGQECVPAVDELLKLTGNKSAVVQRTALEVLASYTKASSFQPWIDGLADNKDAAQKAMLIRVFGSAKLAGAKDAVVAAAVDPKASSQIRYEAVRALTAFGDKGASKVLQPMIADADPLVRMAVADAVAKLELDELGPGIVPLLKDTEWQVQAAAVSACGAVRPQAAVQPLIDLLRQKGRLQTECAEALFRVTGFEFGLDADRWQEQWTKLMAIEGWRIPTREELAKKAESRKKYNEIYGQKEAGLPSFAGIPTTSTNVLFIIDVSGSMDDLVVEREKFQGYADDRKFTVVRAQLLSALDSLTENTNFNIVKFASDVTPWKPKLVPANIVNREAAKSWAQQLKPIGGTEDQNLAAAGLGGLADLDGGKTNTLKAALYPFGIDPENPPKAAITGGDKVSIKNKLDTVYFLSDGRPSVGKIIDTIEILKEVRRYNEAYRIVFHTIAIGEFQKEFLRDLAVQNGGVFIDLGR